MEMGEKNVYSRKWIRGFEGNDVEMNEKDIVK